MGTTCIISDRPRAPIKANLEHPTCLYVNHQVRGFQLHQDPSKRYPYAIKTDDDNDVVYGTLVGWGAFEHFYDRLSTSTTG